MTHIPVRLLAYTDNHSIYDVIGESKFASVVQNNMDDTWLNGQTEGLKAVDTINYSK